MARPADEDSDSEDMNDPQPWTGLFLHDDKADVVLDSEESSEDSEDDMKSTSPMLDDTNSKCAGSRRRDVLQPNLT